MSSFQRPDRATTRRGNRMYHDVAMLFHEVMAIDRAIARRFTSDKWWTLLYPRCADTCSYLNDYGCDKCHNRKPAEMVAEEAIAFVKYCHFWHGHDIRSVT